MQMLDAIWLPAAQQQNYRHLLRAMSYPGRPVTLSRATDHGSALRAVLSCLLDNAVTLADPHQCLDSSDWRMLQTSNASPNDADYLVCDGSSVPDFLPKRGSLATPEDSATLIVQVDSVVHGDLEWRLTGPGIKAYQDVHLSGLNSGWLSCRNDWVATFPLGIDVFFVGGEQVIALPRTISVEVI